MAMALALPQVTGHLLEMHGRVIDEAIAAQRKPMDASFEVKELTTAIYTATMVDQDDVPLGLGTIETLELSLYDVASGTFINGRDHQNVFNNGQGVTLDGVGLLTWTMEPDDNAIVSDRHKEEVHVAVFDFTWDSGTRRYWHEVELRVQNQRKLP